MNDAYSPLEVAIAISLYTYNVAPVIRAQRLYDAFGGSCAEVQDLVDILASRPAYLATEFALPTARMYVQHALETYGAEARERTTYA